MQGNSDPVNLSREPDTQLEGGVATGHPLRRLNSCSEPDNRWRGRDS